MSQLSATATKGPCGCGGHASTSACGCGRTDCGGCSTGALVRPRFFAGQLLTEEDLELLTGYVTAKSRLHNRHLHGAGVVCGLEVTCNPCGGGKVTVHPGHALDCCGNDVVVPCATELDVNEMVRRLRIESLGGHDCGDPCAETPARPAVTGRDAAGRDVAEPERAGRRYCLWIEYCEEPADPVAPYVTGEPCGGQTCEASRVREGYRFTLRCPAPEETPQNLFDRVRACFADLAEGEKAVSDAQAYDQWGWRATEARAQLDRNEAVRFEQEDLQTLRDSSSGIEAFLERARIDVPSTNAAGEVVEPIDEAFLRSSLDSFHQAARLAVKLDLARSTQDGDDSPFYFREASGEGEERVENDHARAVNLVGKAAPLLRRKLHLLSTSRDRIAAEALADQAVRHVSFEPGAAPEADRALFAYGAFTSDAYQAQAARDLRQLREWLLRRLDGASLGDCRLRREAESLRIPDGRSEPSALGAAARRLLRLVLRYLLDCVCAALNPPCPPCDDPAVLLACLEVEDCEVVEICNLERTWVLSAVAVRYWLPFLRSIGEGLERLCCELRHDVLAPKPKPEVQTPDVHYFRATTPLASTIHRDESFYRILRFTGVSEKTAVSTINTAGSLYSVGLRSSLAPALGLPELDLGGLELGGAGPAAIEERVAAVLRRSELRRSLVEEVSTAVGGEVEERLSAATAGLEERTTEAASTLGKLERMVKNRLTVTELQKSQPFKELKGTSTELKKTVRDLEKANADLRERLEKLEKLEKERES